MRTAGSFREKWCPGGSASVIQSFTAGDRAGPCVREAGAGRGAPGAALPGRWPGWGRSACAFASCSPLGRPPPCTAQRTSSFTSAPDQHGQSKGPVLPTPPLDPPPRTAGEGRTRDLGTCEAAVPGLSPDSIPTANTPVRGLVSSAPESTTPERLLAPPPASYIQAGLSGERRGPRDSRDARHRRGGARWAGSRGKDGSSRRGYGPRAPPPTAALFSR